MEPLMSEMLTINLVDEATHLHYLFYKLDIPWEHKYTSIEGYEVEALTIHDIVNYLYIGIKDRSGSILIWAKPDTKDRVKFISTSTRYGRVLPPELDIVAIGYIDAIINDYLREYVYRVGSQYSTLLFSRVSDSFTIGVGQDIRIIEWEEGVRKGILKPSWLKSDYYKTSYRVESIFTLSDNGCISENGFYQDLVSDNPAEVNAAILNDPTTH